MMAEDRWQAAAEAVELLVSAFVALGSADARTVELWAAPFEAALANEYDGTQVIPEALPELRARCEAVPLTPAPLPLGEGQG